MKSENTFVIGILAVLLVVALFSQFFIESRKSATDNVSFEYLKTYTNSYPDTTTDFIGDSEAQIQVLVYFDNTMDINELPDFLHFIDSEYIKKKRVKLYLKPILTVQDTREKKDRYSFASKFYCSAIDSVDDFTKMLFEDDESSCETKHDVLLSYGTEIEHLGLHGINTRFYIGLGNNYDVIEGIPNEQRFERLVRLREITLGI